MPTDRGLLPGKRLLQGRGKPERRIGFANCGGCPGKKAVLRAKLLVERGADTIAFASCIQKGTPIGYPCPFHARMKKLLQTWLPENIRLLDYTHDAPGEKTSMDNKQQERD